MEKTTPFDPSEALRQLRSVTDNVRSLGSEVQAASGRVRNWMQGEVGNHPYRSVGMAFGVGYVLGGGLASMLTVRLVRFGIRAVVFPMLMQQMQGPSGAGDGDGSAASTTPPSSGGGGRATSAGKRSSGVEGSEPKGAKS